MFYIRTTKTISKSTAVQIVSYLHRKTVIRKHIGSAKTQNELDFLIKSANEYIFKISGQIPLLKPETTSSDIALRKYKYLGIKYSFAFKVLEQIFNLIGFNSLNNKCLKEFSIIRAFEPVSKQKSIELLKTYFDITYSKGDMYRKLKDIYTLQDSIEEICINYARNNLGFNFSIVFYDVTTLYFESFTEDELRKCGFSKDNKHNQPQVVIGLIVNNDGFPISIKVFEGNKFEGHTLIPSILKFRQRYHVKKLTVVADAAMISIENIKNLRAKRLNYIVGARIGNCNLKIIKNVFSKLKQIDGNTIRKRTKYGMLVCEFSKKRYAKDKYELDKQIKKANQKIQNPSSLLSRYRYIKKTDKSKFVLNESLIKKNEMLLGIKGYYNNLRWHSNQDIIKQYHNLWKIEKAFRISKSDLKIRPVFNRKKEMITIHVIICFVALAICKYVELQGDISTEVFRRMLKSVTEAQLVSLITEERTTMQNDIPEEVVKLLKDLNLSY